MHHQSHWIALNIKGRFTEREGTTPPTQGPMLAGRRVTVRAGIRTRFGGLAQACALWLTGGSELSDIITAVCHVRSAALKGSPASQPLDPDAQSELCVLFRGQKQP